MAPKPSIEIATTPTVKTEDNEIVSIPLNVVFFRHEMAQDTWPTLKASLIKNSALATESAIADVEERLKS